MDHHSSNKYQTFLLSPWSHHISLKIKTHIDENGIGIFPSISSSMESMNMEEIEYCIKRESKKSETTSSPFHPMEPFIIFSDLLLIRDHINGNNNYSLVY